MKNKHDVIYSMCLLFDPDYDKLDNTQAKNLYNLMEKLYNEDLEPFLKHKLKIKNLFGETNVPKRRKRRTRQ